MSKLGVLEIFFGPAWKDEDRPGLAQFLGKYNFDFHVYAPKSDAALRKNWREPWSVQYLERLRGLTALSHAQNVRFGVALSPFGLGDHVSASDREILREKIRQLDALHMDIIAIFFDDMPVHDGLAQSQIQALEIVRGETKAQILFCPTFYSDDPILEKVFGAKPPGYIEDLAQSLPPQIEIVWTGPKVISNEIPADHLARVRRELHRAPFICDNYFANDGPKNCKFLKLRFPEGRSPAAFAQAGFWGLNPMNQIHLSQIVMLAFLKTAREGMPPEAALDRAFEEMCSPGVAKILREHRLLFLKDGLDQIDEPARRTLATQLSAFDEPAAREVRAWLDGQFIVGNECLTD